MLKRKRRRADAIDSTAQPARLEKLEKISSVLQNVTTVIALILGGIWAIYTFSLQRTNADNLSIKVTPKVTPYDSGSQLLTIKVDVSNLGKRMVRAAAKGCQLSVRKLPRNKLVGQVLTHDETTKKDLEWVEAGEGVVTDLDMLRHYEVGSYALEPGVEYHEIESVVMPADALVLIKVTFWLSEEDAITEYHVCDIPTEALRKK